MPPDPVELRRWVEKADHDRRAAETLIACVPPLADTAAFHCQQAVEKYLKAYLFACGIDFEKTHDLRALVLSCADRDREFDSLRLKVADLNAFAVRFRYPGPADPTVEQVRAALEVVGVVRDFVMARLTGLI